MSPRCYWRKSILQKKEFTVEFPVLFIMYVFMFCICRTKTSWLFIRMQHTMRMTLWKELISSISFGALNTNHTQTLIIIHHHRSSNPTWSDWLAKFVLVLRKVSFLYVLTGIPQITSGCIERHTTRKLAAEEMIIVSYVHANHIA